MGLTNFPRGISSFGVPVLAGGNIAPTGTVYFLDSGIGSDGNDGLSSERPFATLDYAFSRCASNNGDYIIVAPGHAETITTAVGLDVAGVTGVGVGPGRSRPAFTGSGGGCGVNGSLGHGT